MKKGGLVYGWDAIVRSGRREVWTKRDEGEGECETEKQIIEEGRRDWDDERGADIG